MCTRVEPHMYSVKFGKHYAYVHTPIRRVGETGILVDAYHKRFFSTLASCQSNAPNGLSTAQTALKE